MIDKLRYDQVDAVVLDLRKQAEIIRKLLRGRNVPDLQDFVEKVDAYAKFLENTVQLNKDADKALEDVPTK